ncbi:XrtA-associated tyrosine autokinase [Catenovulum maritimum]|uniref:non-specific protein-tyrosine kinase n=1 Tax=Catenovulum maritimum TaxID=1513271 RepID=A0A0J8GPC8_9ALTE|nr:XrtA-associated tyrosine autokinase [Catenovulum maritimum]KMT64655.1 exopolysaccharide biosynthesis protein [Catenovulum maritimum]
MSTIEKALAKKKLSASAPKPDAIDEQANEPLIPAHATEERQVEPKVSTSSETQKFDAKKSLIFPLEKLDELGYVSVSSKRKLVNEELRAIKRKLLNNAFGGLSKTLKGGNLITVSSTRPGEGKSFTAINLALSIALEQDKTVLLVDADVLKPSVSKKLEVTEQVGDGLMEYLLDEVQDVKDIMYSTNLDNLKFIPAGRPSHLSTELLASQKMADLAEEFITRYPDRVVIMDSPPLLGINETVVVANLSGQVVIVVEEEKTKVSELKAAVAQLDKDKAIGFVMNKSKKQSSDSGYGYGYAYAYAGKE